MPDKSSKCQAGELPPSARRRRDKSGLRSTLSQSDTGRVGSIQSQQTEPMRKRVPVRYRGALQFEDSLTTRAIRVGLRIAPTCPEVFMAPLKAPARDRPISMHVPQAAASRKLDEAPPSAISTAAHTGESINVPARVKRPAAASAEPPTAVRPIRRPNRRVSESVVTPPRMSATVLNISGRPARMAA